jgi:hypothetical protein
MEGIPKPPNHYRIESVYQAGEILKLIANSREPLGPTDITQRLDVTMNTAFRMCTTLEEVGFLEPIGDKYQLGMGLALIWAKKKVQLETSIKKDARDLRSIERAALEDPAIREEILNAGLDMVDEMIQKEEKGI